MNPNIIKAGLDTGMLNYVDNETPRYIFINALALEEDLERFAELIIQECARIAELKEQGYKDFDPDTSVGWYIRKHFGFA